MSWLFATGTERRSTIAEWAERVAWVLPGLLLFTLSLKLEEPTRWTVTILAALLFMGGILLYRWARASAWRPGVGLTAICALALVASHFTKPMEADDLEARVIYAVLFLLPVPYLIRDFGESANLLMLRRARSAVEALLARKAWPEKPREYRQILEIRQLRESILLDPTPALALLNESRFELRWSALLAMEYRPTWLPGQAEQVAHLLGTTEEEYLRVGCLLALGPIQDQAVVQLIIEYLRDPMPLVRKAAIEALLHRVEKRWHLLRKPFHDVLNDPRYTSDGPLTWSGSLLPKPALTDLMSWSGEAGCISLRATQTIIAYYQRALNESGSPEFVEHLLADLVNPTVPSTLRVELGHLLQSFKYLDKPLLERLLNANEPSAMRLLAAESLLLLAPHAGALNTLKEIARQPNRELALTTAAIVQTCLNLDMGLPWGEKRPRLHSKQAAEVTRRVMAWANGQTLPPAGSLASYADDGSMVPPSTETPPHGSSSAEDSNDGSAGWEW